jgi:hypothetical protein
MGLLNDLAKIADSSLKAVEDGTFEKAVSGAIEKLETEANKAVHSAEKVAELPEKLVEKAVAKHAQAAQVVQTVQRSAARTITVIQE